MISLKLHHNAGWKFAFVEHMKIYAKDSIKKSEIYFYSLLPPLPPTTQKGRKKSSRTDWLRERERWKLCWLGMSAWHQHPAIHFIAKVCIWSFRTTGWVSKKKRNRNSYIYSSIFRTNRKSIGLRWTLNEYFCHSTYVCVCVPSSAEKMRWEKNNQINKYLCTWLPATSMSFNVGVLLFVDEDADDIFDVSCKSLAQMITENGIEQLRNDRQFSMNYDLWLENGVFAA